MMYTVWLEQLKNLPSYELVKEKNYINKPKASGYRSIHLILRPANTAYDINYIEIQVRSAAMNLLGDS